MKNSDKGNGKHVCDTCGESGMVVCEMCKGSGKIESGLICHVCRGRVHIPCNECNSHGSSIISLNFLYFPYGKRAG